MKCVENINSHKFNALESHMKRGRRHVRGNRGDRIRGLSRTGGERMSDMRPQVRHFRFGLFDVDVHSGELRRQGVKVKLQEQPFQVLVMLLERKGEIVLREEIQKRLWPDTIVEFESNLNAAIKRLREALGDSAGNPRFVETIPRRGYRFIASTS